MMCVGTTGSLKGLEIAATAPIKRKGRAWLVPSQSGKGRYTVIPDDAEPFCSCLDHEEGGHKCKHIFAVEYVMRRESNSDGTTTVEEILTVRAVRKTYPQDWRSYNRAQTNEKEKFLDLLDDLCRGIPNRSDKRTAARRCLFTTRCSPLASKSIRRFPAAAS